LRDNVTDGVGSTRKVGLVLLVLLVLLLLSVPLVRDVGAGRIGVTLEDKEVK
jgi:hypothetical protein